MNQQAEKRAENSTSERHTRQGGSAQGSESPTLDLQEIIAIIDEILGKEKGSDLLDFFRAVMPESEDELTIILARKANAVYKVFAKAYPEIFGAYNARVIHDRNIGEWLATNPKPAKVNLVDDTIFYGKSMNRCLDLLAGYGFTETDIECFVFYVNEDLLDEDKVAGINKTIDKKKDPCERPVIYIEKSVASSKLSPSSRKGNLVTNYKYMADSKSYTVYYVAARARGDLRHLARYFVELIHAAAEPYVAYLPVYQFSMHEAASMLFGLDDFPDPDHFLKLPFTDGIKSKLENNSPHSYNTTFASGEIRDVFSACAFLDTHLPHEKFSMLRFYANYRLKIVTIIPYTVFDAYTSTITDLKNYISNKSAFPSAIHDFLYCDNGNVLVQEENHKTLNRLTRYTRSLCIAKEVFGSSLNDHRHGSSIIDKAFNTVDCNVEALLSDKSLFNWLPDGAELSATLQDEKAVEDLVSYEIPKLYSDKKPIHKHAFDLYFNKISNDRRRTHGVSVDLFAKHAVNKIGVYKRWDISALAYILIVILCDRGVSIPSARTKKKDGVFHSASVLRDGEMAVEAYAEIPGLWGLPWMVSKVRGLCGNEWSAQRTKLCEKLKAHIGDHRSELVDKFFSVEKDKGNTIGDYLIHGDKNYFYREWESPVELDLFNIIVKDYEQRYQSCQEGSL